MAQFVMLPGMVIVRSFSEGDKIVRNVPARRETEVDALAHALWLDRRGFAAEADAYLDDYIRRSAGCRH